MLDTLLQNNLLPTLATIAAGLVAYLIYFLNKVDDRKKVAKLILQEIRYAEQRVRMFKEHGQYKLHDRLLPSNSWSQNLHMFVDVLSESEVDTICTFYSKITYIDTVIESISKQKNSIILTQTPVQNTPGTPSIPAQQQVQNFYPMSQQILKETSDNVEFIYNTPVVEKLRKFGDRKLIWHY